MKKEIIQLNPWRLLKLGETDAYISNVLPEMLEIARNRGIIGNTMAICRPSSYVWLGEKTSFSCVNASFCKEKGIPIVRGIMAGGVALLGDLCHCILVSDKVSSITYKLLIKSIIKSCQILGLDAKYKSKSNDILVKGKKITGTGIHNSKNVLLLTGTLSFDFDYELAKKVLIIPAKKFEDKKAKNIEDWVTTAKKELNREVSFEEVEAAFIQGFGEILQVEFEIVSSFTEPEKQIFEDLKKKYNSEEWLKTGRWSPVKEYKND